MPPVTINQQSRKQELARWWGDPDTYATCLLVLLIDSFGSEAFVWEPETIRIEVRTLCGAELPPEGMDKLMALLTALTTNLFYVSMETFHHVCNALSGSEADFATWDPLEVEEAAWGLTELGLSDPPDKKEKYEERFSHEVRRYIGALLKEEAYVSTPDVLYIAEWDGGADEGADVTFADEPALLNSFYKNATRKEQQLKQGLRDDLRDLLDQLTQLPLGDRTAAQGARKYAEKLLKGLESSTTSADAPTV